MRKPHRFALLAAILLLALTCPGWASAAGSKGEVVGYYASWAAAGGYTPDQIPAERLTQINYAFAEIEDGRAVLTDPDRDGGILRQLTALRRRNPALRIVLAVGGWDGSGGFSGAAATEKSRKAFARSCADLLQAYDLDGVDLDWEYPVSGGAPGTPHRPEDGRNFTLLLQELRRTLDRQGGRRVLTIAAPADAGYLRRIEPQAVGKIVDHIFLMGYDFHGPWEARTGLNAPLYDASGVSVDGGVSAWLAQGVPAEKLVLGMPLYGYIYHGVPSREEGLGQTYQRANSISWSRIKADYLGVPAYRAHRHGAVPYLYGRNTFLSYDDPESAAAKAEAARRRGLGGMGFWELSQDAGGDLIQSACAAWSGAYFQDVPRDAWYAGAVERVCAAGLMNGTGPGGIFSPGGAVTRGQLAAILHRLAGEPGAPAASFSDVSPSAYYSEAVAWAAARGVAEGFPDGTFRPDLPVSRQQLAAILWRYAGLEGADSGARASLRGYSDGGEVSGYAREAMSWALAEGILRGSGGALQPHGQAARGQTAVLLDRFMTLLEA